ncbi:hypothetical protein BsWGS_21115 [Bradybaena similaris]
MSTKPCTCFEADIFSVEVDVIRPGQTEKVKMLIKFKDSHRRPVSVAAAKQDLFDEMNIPTSPGAYDAIISMKDGTEICMEESAHCLQYKDDIVGCDVILFRSKCTNQN